MSFVRDVIVVFFKELLCFVRDRNIVIYSIVLPIFLYPITFWVMNQVMLLQRGAVENQNSKVAVLNGESAPELMSLFETTDMIEVVPGHARIGKDGVDAVLDIQDVYYDPASPCFRMRLEYDQANEYSVTAKERVLGVMTEFRELVLLFLALDHELPETVVEPFQIETHNIASSEQMGIYILGHLLPMMIIIMAAMGTLYPAIDVIVGERERKTLETTLLTPNSRFSLVLGKFGAVVLAGIVAVFLNIAALGLTASHTIFLMGNQGNAAFSIPLRSLPLVLLTTIIIAAGFGAASILIASYARNFREGQSYVTPFFIISFQPAIISALPGITLTTGIALVPVANASLMFRDLLNNIYQWDKIALVLLSLTVYTGVVLWAASSRLKNENTLWGEKTETIKKATSLLARIRLWRKP
ncbi:ABC transporter permease [bacterium]|nr:ABC transporter permease [bacterium]